MPDADVDEGPTNAFDGYAIMAKFQSTALEKSARELMDVSFEAVAEKMLPLLGAAVQPEGDTNFAGLADKVAALVSDLDVPVIAKEVGAGISRADAELLRQAGVRVIDVAGSGGTSWSRVEHHRRQDGNGIGADFVAADFSDGLPIDVFPANGSALIGAGDPAHAGTTDFNGRPRGGSVDAGAYAHADGNNPGWMIVAGFKPLSELVSRPPPRDSDGTGQVTPIESARPDDPEADLVE